MELLPFEPNSKNSWKFRVDFLDFKKISFLTKILEKPYGPDS